MRRYSVSFENQGVSTAKDLIWICAPATMMLCVIRAQCGQDGGVVSENGRLILQRVSSSNSGTSVTPEPLEKNEQAATFTAGYLTADNTLVNRPLVGPRAFNWVSGDEWVPAPEERIWVPPSGKLVYRLASTPAAKNVSASLVVIEIG